MRTAIGQYASGGDVLANLLRLLPIVLLGPASLRTL
jgi:hypothetical protein